MLDQYWYLCARTGIIKYAGEFADYDECDQYLDEKGYDAVWIFLSYPIIEEAD